MGDQMTFANRATQIEPILERCIGLRKEKVPGAVLETIQADIPSPADRRARLLLEKVREGKPLAQEEAREIIWFVDFLAAAEPDNVNIRWSADVLKLASKLRQDYAKAFGEKAYDT